VLGLCDTREISILSLDNLSDPRDLLIQLFNKKEILRGSISSDGISMARVQIPVTPLAIPPDRGACMQEVALKGPLSLI